MKQKTVLVFEIILCLVIQVIIYLISHFIYADAFHVKYITVLLNSWIIVTIINWKREINTDRPKLRWFTLLLISITLAVFLAYKPGFSYARGKEIVTAQGYDNIYELQDRAINAFRLKHTRLVPDAYLYAGEKNNVKYYILLSPINGEIETERMGEGSYLDAYFEMKYGK